ncbi:MAG: hypothetical protein HRU28_19185 [Rhizobiales bacterium]|nr:hypothetical protein [Hyphomicrobiales bacterium]
MQKQKKLSSMEIYSGIVDAIGTKDFLKKTAELLEDCIPYQGLFLFLYSKNSAPSSLGSFKDAINFKEGSDNYIKYTYVINPVFYAFQKNIEPATYLISDLITKSHSKNIFSSDLNIRIEEDETIGVNGNAKLVHRGGNVLLLRAE